MIRFLAAVAALHTVLAWSPVAVGQTLLDQAGDDLITNPHATVINLEVSHDEIAHVAGPDQLALWQNDDEDRALSDGAAPPPAAHGHYHKGRPDAHAPIGVMGDHGHKKGEVMLSYRFMYMEMDGNRKGTDRIGNSEVLQSYPVTPLDMTMQMHMIGLMYAPEDWVTVMAMLPYVRLEMDHRTRSGAEFTTTSDSIGDIKLSGLFTLYEEGHHSVTGTFGFSLPTGSIDRKDNTPAGRGVLPYPMQTGSGTFDLLLGLGHMYQIEKWSFGQQVSGVIRLEENDRDYELGDRFEATMWAAYAWNDWISTSARLDYNLWGNIDGADPALNPALVPTADPDLRGGQRLDLLIGVNLVVRDGFLKGHRFAVEGGAPLWQNLDGPQLETDWLITVGWQFAF